ncbi:ABC transporter permease [Leucothrix arctica]|uniref:Peptide ABC transporter permease n=1 Tax=Leucothrix arctica TaxID=1481894 RepID=A0A317C5X1_9GAMM|nr:ABC transporter permease [Leucothrix arctica]PWQ93717.1 peptide ABC transporter permease [Leucothrix arctica]
MTTTYTPGQSSSEEELEKSLEAQDQGNDIFYASKKRLMWLRFKQHKVALFSGIMIIFFYLVALFANFVSVQDINSFNAKYKYVAPTDIHWTDPDGSFTRPYIKNITRKLNMETLEYEYTAGDEMYPIKFLHRGYSYKLLGLVETDLHLMGVDDGAALFLMGSDKLGRDIFSKVVHGARISLSIGLIGVFLSLVFGAILGGISGFYGGRTDTLIQRLIEVLMSFPSIPLWMALAASLPPHWSPLIVYFMITLILSLIGWTGIARVVRGIVMRLKEEKYTEAALLSGAGNFYIIRKHLLPGSTSFVIAHATLSIPAMIIAETSLSFLGIGLRPPVVSWGVLLQEAQSITVIANYPWVLYPAFFVIATVLFFNFLGDGLRDAADPYMNRA